MRKLLMTTAIILVIVMAMPATPALALEYDVDEPEEGTFAPSSSVEEVIVVGGGPTEQSNIDRSKNASLAPPSFGSPDSYQPGTGDVLIPHVSYSNYNSSGGGSIGNIGSGGTGGVGIAGSSAGMTGDIFVPPAELGGSATADVTATSTSNNKFTLPDGLYDSDGSLGTLEIPDLGVNIKVYEEESLENLAKGAGHFKATSCWEGNVALAAHNRGKNSFFGQIHTLQMGAKIIYSTQLGTRTYEVFSVKQVNETDTSCLDRTTDNIITLVTCVRDVRDMRWCVQAREVA